jgi:ArsR family transcriptional regulator
MGFAETFKALSDPQRRDILLLLRQGSLPAGEIARQLSIPNTTLSYHLSQLKKADLVAEKKVKNYIYYQLNTSVLEELMLWLKQFQGDDHHETEI